MLVVDDEPAVLSLVQTILRDAGYDVLAARNAREALTILEEHHVDVLLTDVVMPGMSGAELIVEARRRFPNLSVCCMTGYVDKPHAVLEEIPVIAKPFGPQQVLDTIEQVIGRRTKENRIEYLCSECHPCDELDCRSLVLYSRECPIHGTCWHRPMIRDEAGRLRLAQPVSRPLPEG